MQEMKRHKYIMTVLAWTVCFFLSACSNHAADTSHTDKIINDHSSSTNQQQSPATRDSLNAQNDELTKIYTQAITEFIKGAYKRNKTTFDTLFFGKHIYGQPDDFPDIELPETIENTPVRIVTPEVGQKKQQERKSLVYVNMMGWVDKEKAGFILVVFSNGGEHQYDYFIDFAYNATRKEFELEKIEFENYLDGNGQKPKRITLYKDGKYVADK